MILTKYIELGGPIDLILDLTINNPNIHLT